MEHERSGNLGDERKLRVIKHLASAGILEALQEDVLNEQVTSAITTDIIADYSAQVLVQFEREADTAQGKRQERYIAMLELYMDGLPDDRIDAACAELYINKIKSGDMDKWAMRRLDEYARLKRKNEKVAASARPESHFEWNDDYRVDLYDTVIDLMEQKDLLVDRAYATGLLLLFEQVPAPRSADEARLRKVKQNAAERLRQLISTAEKDIVLYDAIDAEGIRQIRAIVGSRYDDIVSPTQRAAELVASGQFDDISTAKQMIESVTANALVTLYGSGHRSSKR